MRLTIDFAAVPYTDDEHHQLGVFHPVNQTIVADPEAEVAGTFALESLDAWRPGTGGKSIDSLLDPALDVFGQLFKSTQRLGEDANGVSHGRL
jgi:hypothetical protein